MTFTEVGYFGAHHRIKASRGRASEHLCIDCGGRASEWAFNHEAPDTYIRTEPRVYSLNPADYDPLCASCHGKRDVLAGQRSVSDEARAKMSAAGKGRTHSPEHVAKQAEASRGPRLHRRGIAQTEDHKRKRLTSTAHTRWHVRRGTMDPDCSLCREAN